jgi:transposase-like protein
MMATSKTVKRKHRSVEERRRIVEQSLGAGVSVTDVARTHGIRSNQVFYWRKLYREGRLGNPAALLPVRVTDAPVDPWGPGNELVQAGAMDLELPHARLRVGGRADTVALRLVLEWLRR